MKESSSASCKPSSEGTAEPQAEASVHVRAEQLAAQESRPALAQLERRPLISGLDLFRPGATCSGFGTRLGLFREGATCAGFETSFSGLFGLQASCYQSRTRPCRQLSQRASPGWQRLPGHSRADRASGQRPGKRAALTRVTMPARKTRLGSTATPEGRQAGRSDGKPEGAAVLRRRLQQSMQAQAAQPPEQEVQRWAYPHPVHTTLHVPTRTCISMLE